MQAEQPRTLQVSRDRQLLVRRLQSSHLTDKITAHQGHLIMVKPATTKLSSRGQVVIPEEIRTRLGLEPGAQFVVVGEGDVVVLKALKPPKMADFKALLDKVRESAEAAGITEEDVERAIREVRTTK
ncbi:MAG: AbrB/MazE/SpoVT family DNA-binding domain-containing protein [Gemmatimonadota bacterium]|nr:AbrB/MazE/SpoVT family DNA-binding domain-containing protein [Gemmatimonadota bacterium]